MGIGVRRIVLHSSKGDSAVMPRISPPVRHEARAIRAIRLTPQGKSIMERVTLRIPEQQIDEVKAIGRTGKFPNRSEAIRSAVREDDR